VLGHDTPHRTAYVVAAGLGLETIDQLVPFHCSTNVLVAEPSKESPTAKQLVVLGHDTPLSKEAVAPVGLGLVRTDQLVPFHCSTSVVVAPKWAEDEPTAKQLVALGHDTPFSSDWIALVGFGVVTTDQLVPFHCSANVFVADAVT
jgi:hypothetical protein